MNNNLVQTAQAALDLMKSKEWGFSPIVIKLEAALAEPQPEPVAYKVWHPNNPRCSYVGTEPPSEFRSDTGEPDEYFGGRVLPLYAAPQTGLRPLTAEQVWANDEIMSRNSVGGLPMHELMRMVRTIEAAHGIE